MEQYFVKMHVGQYINDGSASSQRGRSFHPVVPEPLTTHNSLGDACFQIEKECRRLIERLGLVELKSQSVRRRRGTLIDKLALDFALLDRISITALGSQERLVDCWPDCRLFGRFLFGVRVPHGPDSHWHGEIQQCHGASAVRESSAPCHQQHA